MILPRLRSPLRRMLLLFRYLKPTLAAASAALLAIGSAVASPGVSMPESAHGAPGGLQYQVALAGHGVGADGVPSGDHHQGGHGSHQHGSDPTTTAAGSDQQHTDHGCDGCFCVATAGCAAPAAPTPITSASAAPGSLHVGFPRTSVVPSPPLHHDIFRPPRAT